MKQNLSGPTNDYLHANPELYGKVFDTEAGEICMDLFAELKRGIPCSALDIGCGLGREVSYFATCGVEAMGVDFVPSMIKHARETFPGQEFISGDLREFRLKQTFDLVTCLGSCLNYMLSNEDLVSAIKTIRAHCHDDSLVVIEPLNSSSFIGSTTPPATFKIPGTTNVAHAKYEWNQLTQVMHRERYWSINDGAEAVHDTYTVRLLFSQELKFFLEQGGFEVVALKEKQRSQVYNKALFIIAQPR